MQIGEIVKMVENENRAKHVFSICGKLNIGDLQKNLREIQHGDFLFLNGSFECTRIFAFV